MCISFSATGKNEWERLWNLVGAKAVPGITLYTEKTGEGESRRGGFKRWVQEESSWQSRIAAALSQLGSRSIPGLTAS
jgi:hypothetical protein